MLNQLKRKNSIDIILKYPKIEKEDQKVLESNKKILQYSNYSLKAISVVSLFSLYKMNFFKNTHKFFIREISSVLLITTFNIYGNILINNHIWQKVQPIIRKYAIMKE